MTFHMKGNDNIFLQLLTGKNPKFKDGKHYCMYIHLFKLWGTKTIQGTDELTVQLDIGKLQSNYSVHTVMLPEYNILLVQPWGTTMVQLAFDIPSLPPPPLLHSDTDLLSRKRNSNLQ